MTVNEKKEWLADLMTTYCTPCNAEDGCDNCEHLKAMNEVSTALDLYEKTSRARKALDLLEKQEQGLIVELPVPLGTKIWEIIPLEDEQGNITYGTLDIPMSYRSLWLWGDFAFATREEAEARLKELRGE